MLMSTGAGLLRVLVDVDVIHRVAEVNFSAPTSQRRITHWAFVTFSSLSYPQAWAR
jgi:hypothetical protein